MGQFIVIVTTVFIEHYVLKNFLSINIKEYQGFTTRFFTPNESGEISKDSIIFWILVSPVFSLLSYLFILVVNSVFGYELITYKNLWLISLFFWMLDYIIILFLDRKDLVNQLFIFIIAISSVIFNIYFSFIAFTGNFNDILPDSSDILFQFYSLIILFFISWAKLTYERNDYSAKRDKYIFSRSQKFLSKFTILNNLEEKFLYLVLSILIIENFERPYLIRKCENLRKTKTRNIAQNNSQSDWHSVYLLIKELFDYMEVLGISDIKNLTDKNILDIAYKYNNSKKYSDNVLYIYQRVYSNLRGRNT